MGDQAVYLNDLIWHQKYAECLIISADENQVVSRLEEFTSKYEYFLPFNQIRVKEIQSGLSLIVAVSNNHLFMFKLDEKECTL